MNAAPPAGRCASMDLWLWHETQPPWAMPVADDVLRVQLCTAPGAVSKVNVHFGDRYDGIAEQQPLAFAGCDDHGAWWRADLRVPTRRFRYLFEVHTPGGDVWWFGADGAMRDPAGAGVFQVPYVRRGEALRVPDWTARAVAYQVFPDRFARGGDPGWPHDRIDEPVRPDSVFGGNLAGITEHLDHLVELGVRVLYCTPVFAAPSNHKYDTEDYFRIDPQFGTEEDLRRLVSEAHRRGIRVLLDAVFNHSGERFAPFQDVIRLGRQSAFWDWFFIDGDAVNLERVNYETFATRLRTMPKLNTDHPEAAAYLLKVAEHWMRACDIDGWRLDVANEVSPEFWRAFRRHVKGLKRDAVIIGEVWHDALPWLLGDQFDGVMNYVLRDIILAGVVDRAIPPAAMARRLTRLALRYPPAAAQASLNLLGSHDTERLWTRAGGRMDAVEAAVAVQFVWPGMPMVYYGDEIGLAGGTDPDCRRPMPWDPRRQNLALRAWFHKLARLRLESDALASPDVQVEANETGLTIVRGVPGRRLWLTLSQSGSLPRPAAAGATCCLERKRPADEWSIGIWQE
jgi:cyclomaltodextrinase